MRTSAERFWLRVERGDGCWEWSGARLPNGYGRANYLGKDTTAHRIAWILTHGPIVGKFDVAHKCDNRPCVRPDHLFLATHAENMADMVRKGRSASGDRNPSRQHPERLIGKVGASVPGERNGMARLTAAQVLAMRSSGLRAAPISRQYGISLATASDILLRRRWRHV